MNKIEKEVDEILLDFCTKEKCSESCDHKALKKVVRERLIKLCESKLYEGLTIIYE